MARTPLMRWIMRFAADHAEAERRRLDLKEVGAARAADRQRASEGLSRREFLAGLGGLALAAPTVPTAQLASRRAASVAVVGGGIAGLTSALTLADAGITANVYESSIRVGGRMYSDARGYWQERQVSEWCGELIDTEHKTLLSLARRFRLPIVDRLAAEPAGAEPTYYVFGQYYPQKQVDLEFKPVSQTLRRDLQAAGELTTFATSTPGGVALDNMSISAWIESRVPGGQRSPLGRLLDLAYASEYGAETSDLSALNLVYLLGYQPKEDTLSITGTSDERYHIAGGNQQLPQRIARSLRPGTVQLRWRMIAIDRDADGSAPSPSTRHVAPGPFGPITSSSRFLLRPCATLISAGQGSIPSRRRRSENSGGRAMASSTFSSGRAPGASGVPGRASVAASRMPTPAIRAPTRSHAASPGRAA